MRTLGEEIAVLDGLDDLSSFGITPVAAASDGRIGRRPATGAGYANRKSHNYETRKNVLDASEGANYSGGSSYAPGLPLLPSTVGLADLATSDLVNYSKVTNVLPPKKNVVDPSGGANYTGGSNYAPGMPLLVSGDPGLAESFAMLEGTPLIQGGYGQPGLGYWEEKYSDFDGYNLGTLDAHFGSSLSIEDGRIGQKPATGAEYATRKTPNYETRRNVLDASEGANYSGGSSYAPGLPLGPSTWGLAGLARNDGLDGLSDLAFFKALTPAQQQAFKKVAGKTRIKNLKAQAKKIAQAIPNMPLPAQQTEARRKLTALATMLNKIRSVRTGVAKSLLARRGCIDPAAQRQILQGHQAAAALLDRAA